MRRSPLSKNYPGHWDLPGGKVDAGESFDVALAREVSEETGLRVSLTGVIGAWERKIEGKGLCDAGAGDDRPQ